MKIRYKKLKNWLLLMASSLLGINLGCDNIFVAEYGCPQATYRVNGIVTNENGQPIAGIGVKALRNRSDEGVQCKYEDTTDADGHYEVVYRDYYDYLDVDFHDIDSAQNGSYIDTTVLIPTADVPLLGGDGGWNMGTGYIIQDVTLKKKPADQ